MRENGAYFKELDINVMYSTGEYLSIFVNEFAFSLYYINIRCSRPSSPSRCGRPVLLESRPWAIILIRRRRRLSLAGDAVVHVRVCMLTGPRCLRLFTRRRPTLRRHGVVTRRRCGVCRAQCRR